MKQILAIIMFLLQPNHLVGLKRKYLKLRFYTVEDLVKSKRSDNFN